MQCFVLGGCYSFTWFTLLYVSYFRNTSTKVQVSVLLQYYYIQLKKKLGKMRLTIMQNSFKLTPVRVKLSPLYPSCL